MTSPRAAGVARAMLPYDAALFFDLFLVGVVREGYGRLLGDAVPGRDDRIAVL